MTALDEPLYGAEAARVGAELRAALARTDQTAPLVVLVRDEAAEVAELARVADEVGLLVLYDEAAPAHCPARLADVDGRPAAVLSARLTHRERVHFLRTLGAHRTS
ncbi:hypothetical protein [Streptomyces sp. KHY 26]|uniref:hypothetical protein n=1 Tax=Streptomyces sp. KHY 26 TaxID=3097359 RepID=UPI00376F37F4